MRTKDLSRTDKEALYIKKMTELQLRWRNPIDSDWDFVHHFSDEELQKGIAETIRQIRFEKVWSRTTTAIMAIIVIFVLLGIIGLLLFGMRQIF